MRSAAVPHDAHGPADYRDAGGSAARAYVLHAAAAVVGLIGAVVALAVVADPYAFRPGNAQAWRPGSAPLRQIKPLQAIARRPDVVFIGTSRTLTGIDPSKIPGGRAYNLGVSGMSGVELEVMADVALRRTPAKTVVIGVDDFMFDGMAKLNGGLRPDAASIGALVEAGLGTLASLEAAKDAARTLGLPFRRGRLRGDGYFVVPPLDARAIDAEIARAVARPPVRYTAEKFACLDRTLAACRRAGVDVLLYAPPLHDRHVREILEPRDGAGSLDRFRAEVVAIADRHGVPFWDFSRPSRLTALPLVDSNDRFTDSGHYTARVGDLILHRLGFPVEPHPEDRDLLAGFGVGPGDATRYAEAPAETTRR